MELYFFKYILARHPNLLYASYDLISHIISSLCKSSFEPNLKIQTAAATATVVVAIQTTKVLLDNWINSVK